MIRDLPTPPPAPRSFRFSAVDAATKFFLLFGAIWGVVGLVVATTFTAIGGPFWNDVVLDRRGVRAEATPISIERTRSSVNGRAVFRVVYSFTDRTGASRTGDTGTTDPDKIARAARREPLAIDYDPDAPGLSRLEGGSASFFGLLVFFPMSFAVVGAGIFAIGLRRTLRLRETYVNGLPARAEVIAVTATSMRINRRRAMRVDYTFDTFTGRVSGRTTSLAPPPVGAAIWVLHLPSDPKRNVVA